ncbi:MAG: FAD-dependent oxidoreductase [Coriobacteriales bacterium]|nr:FAD-dependent oxidoreductase [Coriobacteriales bacterium]
MSNEKLHDLTIIGAGPAGLSASIYAQRALLDTVVLEQEAVGGQVILTSEVDNYPGVPHTDGFSLTDAMRSQAESLGATITMDAVRKVAYDGQEFQVQAAQDTYRSKALILAGGATPRHAGFDGEERFGGHGVSYCATCDGMFYRGKQVFVIGGGNSAAEEALFLTKFASKVTMVVRKDHLRAQASVAREIQNNPKVEIRFNTSITKVEGEELPSTITFRDNTTSKLTQETFDEGSFGIFVFVGRVPATNLVKDLVDLDDHGYVISDERMQTRTPGLFVAGDLRQKPLRQIITAASDGAIAATSVAAFLGQPVEG